MHKIIAAFDGLNYKKATSDYAIAISDKINGYVAGVFLDDNTYTSYKVYQLILDNGVSEKKLKAYKENDHQKRLLASKQFDDECKEKGIPHAIHHDKRVALVDLLHESIFADLLIINNQESFSHHSVDFPSGFIKGLLTDTQCPVLLVPSVYRPIEKIIFLFDGTTNSVFAQKMFNALFTNFQNLPIEVISIKSMESDMHVPENTLLKEWLNRHYKKITYTVLKGIPEVEILHHLYNEHSHSVIVLGAYRRSMLSRWFKSSIADDLIKEIQMPLFIAHNK